MSEAQKKVNAQKARVARAMEPHYKTFGVLKKPGAGQSNDLKTKIYDSWMRWIEGQEQGTCRMKKCRSAYEEVLILAGLPFGFVKRRYCDRWNAFVCDRSCLCKTLLPDI